MNQSTPLPSKLFAQLLPQIPDPNTSNPNKPWAARFFAYDRLALVNRVAFEAIGGWDTHIPFYHTDCDMH